MAIASCPAERGGASKDPEMGQHTPADCPSPQTCKGRSMAYSMWDSDIADTTTGCTYDGFKDKMMASSTSGGFNRSTGLDASGNRLTLWNQCWTEVWGSTLISDMWYDCHNKGTKCGSAVLSIDGAAKFRTYSPRVYAEVPQTKMWQRFEE